MVGSASDAVLTDASTTHVRETATFRFAGSRVEMVVWTPTRSKRCVLRTMQGAGKGRNGRLVMKGRVLVRITDQHCERDRAPDLPISAGARPGPC